MFATYVVLLCFSNRSFGFKVPQPINSTGSTGSLLPTEKAVPRYYQPKPTPEDPASKISSNDIAQRLSLAHFEFTLKLYRALVTVGNPQDNMVFSPLLVSTLLTPVLLSARDFNEVLVPSLSSYGKDKFTPTSKNESLDPTLRQDLLASFIYQSNMNTRVQRVFAISKQLQQVLSFSNLTLRSIEAWHKATVATLQDKYYKQLLGAPRGLYLLKKNHDRRLQKILRKWFETTVRKVELPMNASLIAEEVNRWSKAATNDQIEQLVSESFLRRKPSVLLSPVSLQALWLHPFDMNKTNVKGLFYRSSSERKVKSTVRFEIPMMIGQFEIPLGYSPIMEARVIELPFQNRRTSLFILLPDHMDQPLNILEGNLTSDNVRLILSTLKDETVNLRVPRFFVDSSPKMVEALNILGVEDLFSEAKVKKDSRNPENHQSDLHIYDFVHRVKFIMDEGDQTPDSFSNVSASRPGGPRYSNLEDRIGAFGVKYFELDHPFVFFLWDYIASTIILMGRIVNPQPVL